MTTETMKRCGSCTESKPLTDFTIHRRTIDGLNYACRTCTREQRKVARLKRLDSEREYAQRRWHDRKDELREKKRLRRIETRDRDVVKSRAHYHANKEQYAESHRRWCAANKAANCGYANRRRARMQAARVIPFTVEQLSQRWDYYGRKCWICGSDATASDHVKPLSKGGAHMLANLRPVCKPCNSAKHNRWPYAKAAS